MYRSDMIVLWRSSLSVKLFYHHSLLNAPIPDYFHSTEYQYQYGCVTAIKGLKPSDLEDGLLCTLYSVQSTENRKVVCTALVNVTFMLNIQGTGSMNE